MFSATQNEHLPEYTFFLGGGAVPLGPGAGAEDSEDGDGGEEAGMFVTFSSEKQDTHQLKLTANPGMRALFRICWML